ncbi:DoxX family protein [Micromonospora globispora]|uniref:DoxX family protein n=1 Tax=Micromonospora globispora TaxID=1450148 RepID=A0A317KJD4_9ACTN|nr:DoxX family protein [Micromonospora globispora]PWU52698.1 DoxX family protein [Micromonospora globispora]RQW82344.1 DoxX family protein [Micromonospora globispora]
MNVLLWALQVILALIFLGAGLAKITLPEEKLRERMALVPPARAKLLGTAEVLGALGLILPAVTGIAPVLTPLAAVGLAIVLLGAVVLHARAKETQMAVVTAVLLLAALVVAWGRFGPYAF